MTCAKYYFMVRPPKAVRANLNPTLPINQAPTTAAPTGRSSPTHPPMCNLRGGPCRDVNAHHPQTNAAQAALPSTTAPPATAPLVREIEEELVDNRESLLRHLNDFDPTAVPKEMEGPQTQVAGFVLARLWKGGRCPIASATKWLEERGLKNCHAAQEIVMHAMRLQKTLRQTTQGSALSLPSVEASCERVYGLWHVFGDCRAESDWKKPANAQRTWKSKVKWHLLKRYDASALQEDEYRMPAMEHEVAGGLQDEAFTQRNLGLSETLSSTLEEDAGEGQ